uniref:Uncharacterized protein n=1 Tax=Strombidium rassoulzadegani TaxID=1082188 RepID=A0A7S3CSN3_9SPIT|mmetsp:Transcript_7198/g.12153  ORF Transcript_7198/g.12153 Transcript_7198/m.12153 type:complete len:190 (+) Transcript_7198:190-759(+)
MIRETISEKRSNQKYVILEGMCNSTHLSDFNDQLELRFMDELFKIEKIIGEVEAIISFQYQLEQYFTSEDKLVYEQFPDPPPVEEKPKPAEGEEEEEQAPPEEDDGEKKAPAFKPEMYNWTVSDRNPKNLPHLYHSLKGLVSTTNDDKRAKDFDPNNQKIAIAKCLDSFFGRLQDSEIKYLYWQVTFDE